MPLASPRAVRSVSFTIDVDDFYMASSILCDLETVSEDELANVLEHFFCSIRKKNGEECKRSGYIAARGAIQRQFPGKKDQFER